MTLRTLNKILLVLFFLLIAFPAFAADYYVRDCDGDSSCGTGAGTSWTNPFDTIVAAETAVQTAGRSATGDTIWVADGTYLGTVSGSSYVTTLNVPTNSNAVITVKKATASEHGTETGWDNAYGDGQATITGRILFSTGYWTLDGTSYTDKDTGHGIKVVGPVGANTIGIELGAASANIVIQKVEITSPNVPLTYDCVRLATCTRAGIYMRNGADNITMDRIYIHDLALPLMILGNDNVVYKNSFAQRNESTTTGDPTPVTHSEFASISFNPSTNLNFYNSIFEDMEGTAIIAVMNGADVTGLNYFNNVAYYTPTASPQTGFSNGFFTCTNSGTTCTNVNIYNNTFVNIPNRVAINITSSAESVTNMIVKNNLWWCDAASCGDAAHTVNAQITYDNNWYGGVTYTSGEAGAIDGEDEDPFTSSSTYNYTLTDDSSPIGEGSNLTLVAPFTTYGIGDIVGNLRSIPWDIGAYKYGDAAPDTAAPTISSRTILESGVQLVMVFDEAVYGTDWTGFTLDCDGGEGENLVYLSGNGSNSITFTIRGRAIDGDPKETCTLDYATVLNGIQDASGNDLATIGDPVSVTNNSTFTPTTTTYTVTLISEGECSASPSSRQVTYDTTATFTCSSNGNYGCADWTGTCGGSGRTTYVTNQIDSDIGDCTVIQSCYKISPDVTLGSGAAVTIGSGAVGTLY